MKNVVVLGAAHPHIFGLAKTAASLEGFKVTCVYDQDAQVRDAAAAKLGVPAVADLDKALADKPVLALVGAVPTYRAELCARAAQAGAGVLVDKPLALTHADLDDLIKRVTAAGKPLSVYYPYRGSAPVLAAKAAVEQGRIGKLVRVMSFGPHKLNAPTRPDWHWTRKGNGGALIDIGAHHFDLCHWLAGGKPSVVTAMHANFDQPSHKEFQDIAQAQIRFDNGVLGHVEVDWINPTAMKNFGDTRVWLAGTKGKIEIRMGDEKSVLLYNDQVAGEKLDESAFVADEAWDQKLMLELAAGRQGVVSLSDIWTTSRLSLCAFESAEKGSTPVNVPGK